MRKYATVLFSSTIVLASGCAVIGYRAPEGVPVAKINIKSEGNKWICISGERHNLRADSEGYADIPAGNRVTIGSRYNNYVYGGISTSCNPSSSIIPKAGQRLRFPHIFFTRPGPGSVVAARFHSARSIPVTRRPIRAMAEARGAAIRA